MISHAVSSLADAALLLPASVLMLLYLALLREGRLIIAFAACLAAAALITIALKLVFHACGHTITEVRVISPSGHVAFGAAFYGSLAIMLASGRGRAVASLATIATSLLVLAIGISRVRVGAHSIVEVLIGFAVGGVAIALFLVLRAWARHPRLPWIPIAIGFAAAVVLLGGKQFSLERSIATHARRIAASLDMCAPAPAGLRDRFSSPRY